MGTLAELQHHRYEGRCVECMQFGTFNNVAQRCDRNGIMVIQIDHMPLARERIGDSEMRKRRKAAGIKLDNERNARCAARAVV